MARGRTDRRDVRQRGASGRRGGRGERGERGSPSGRSGRGVEYDQPAREQYPDVTAAAPRLSGQAKSLYPEQFADHLEPELRAALDDCIDVSHVVAWAGDRCVETGPEQATCAHLCNETATLGAVAAEFVARDARTVPAVLGAYLETAEIALDELDAFEDPHTEEAAMVVERSIESVRDALETME